MFFNPHNLDFCPRFWGFTNLHFFFKFTQIRSIKICILEENYCAQKEQQLFDSINERRDAEHQTVRAKFTRFQMDSRKFHRKPKIRMIILNQFLYQLISYQIHFLAFSLLNWRVLHFCDSIYYLICDYNSTNQFFLQQIASI